MNRRTALLLDSVPTAPTTMVAAVLLVAATAATAFAGPPSVSRGGFNWGAAVNQAIRSAQRAQAARSHSGHQPRYTAPRYTTPHYTTPRYTPRYTTPRYTTPRYTTPRYTTPHYTTPRYTTPRYTVPQPQPRRYNTVPQHRVTPRTNITPRYSQPSYRPSTKTYVRPAPRPVRPRSNSVPQTTVTRRTNPVPTRPAAPTTTVRPRANSIPQTATRTTPARNVVPRSPNRPAAVAPVANRGLIDLVPELTQDDINNLVSQLDERDLTLLAQVRQLPLAGLDQAIDNLPGADNLTPDDRRRLREAVRRGDPAAVRRLLNAEAEASPAGRDLIDRAAAVELVDDIVATITDGTLAGGDLAALVDGVQFFPADVRNDVLNVFGQIAVNQQVVLWLLDTDPGADTLPFGFDLPIALVPGLPQDLLIPLDDGPVLVGTGAPGDAVLLGTGNPWEVAGLPVAEPDAEPAEAVAGDYADGTLVIENSTDQTVHYNIDNQPHSLNPQFEQTVSQGSTWIVEFDRGGSFGTAKYQLRPGYYRFRATDRGWELYRIKFKCSLDNRGNRFPFHYVLDNQQRVLGVDEVHDFDGDMPPVITFDNGRGEEKKVKLEKGTYRVAVGPEQTLDIFAGDEVKMPAEPADSVEVASLAAPPRQSDSGDSKADSVEPARQQPMSTGKGPVTETKKRSLPPGLKLFDPVKVLTKTESAKRLPRQFTLFRSAARKLAMRDAGE